MILQSSSTQPVAVLPPPATPTGCKQTDRSTAASSSQGAALAAEKDPEVDHLGKADVKDRKHKKSKAGKDKKSKKKARVV